MLEEVNVQNQNKQVLVTAFRRTGTRHGKQRLFTEKQLSWLEYVNFLLAERNQQTGWVTSISLVATTPMPLPGIAAISNGSGMMKLVSFTPSCLLTRRKPRPAKMRAKIQDWFKYTTDQLGFFRRCGRCSPLTTILTCSVLE